LSLKMSRLHLAFFRKAWTSFTDRPGWLVDSVHQRRSIYTTEACLLKEIRVQATGDLTMVEGVIVKSDRKGKLLDENESEQYCPLCPFKLNTMVKYTDVLILSQFTQSDGSCLSQQVTGLCNLANDRLQRLVGQAQLAGLMPAIHTDVETGLPISLKDYKWRKYNIYYDE